MSTYSNGTTDGFRDRALVLDFFAQVDEEVCHEQLAEHPAMKLDSEHFDAIVDRLAADDLLDQDAFTREYEITNKGAEAHHVSFIAIRNLEAEINRQISARRAAA